MIVSTFVTFNVVVFLPPTAVKTVASVMVCVDTYCVGASQFTLTLIFCIETERQEQALLIFDTGYVATSDAGIGTEKSVLLAVRAGVCDLYEVVTAFVVIVLLKTWKRVAVSVSPYVSVCVPPIIVMS